ncbi:MAG: hypothetical protein ACREEQ_06090, partial [Caulobacteraceae bacterium]
AAGCPARIERGWPNAVALDADLRAGVLNVTVYSHGASERNTTRFPAQWQAATVNPTTFALSQSGQTITVGGAGPSIFYPQNLAVPIGAKAYFYQTIAGDTAASVAAALAAVLEAALGGVSVTGAAIALPAEAEVMALRVGAGGPMTREVSRQSRLFQIAFWAFSPQVRDGACAAVKPVLDGLEFLTLADGSAARLIYESSYETDAPEKELLYRRDLVYEVEWATFETGEATQIVANVVALTGGAPLGSGPTVGFDS